MYLVKHTPDYKKTALALTLTTAMAGAQAAQERFDMYDPTGTLMHQDAELTTSFDAGAGTFTLASPTAFFGLNWTASGGTLFAPGTHTVAINGDGSDELNNSAPTPLANGDGDYTFTVPAGHVGGNINFAWGGSTGIDVFVLWDADGNSIDLDGNGTPGMRMVDGAFPGFSANFHFPTQPQLNTTLAVDLTVTPTPVNKLASVVVDSGIAGGVYDWSATHADILAAEIGGPDDADGQLEFNPAGIAQGTYRVSVSITKGIASGTNFVDISIPSDLSPVDDTDGDGSVDRDDGGANQGGEDADGDGIPNWLDHSGNTATQLQTVNTDTGSTIITTSTGTLAIGTIGAVTDNSPLVTIADIGTADPNVLSSCMGGCFDFEISGLAAGATTQVIVPLSTAIPAHAVYRKFKGTSWGGYIIDDDNSIASAEATGAGASLCPAPGSSSYSSGLTPGHFCVQLTMNDGGANDADGSANGTILDPGGISQINLSAPSTGVGGGGCTLTATTVNPLERSDWWLLMGLLAALGVARRKCNS